MLKFQINGLVRVEDLKKTFSKGHTTNWVFYIVKITEFIFDTIPSYRIDNLQKPYNATLMKTSKSSMKGKDSVLKNFNIT